MRFIQISEFIVDMDSIESITAEELDGTQKGYEEKRSIMSCGFPSGWYTTKFIITMKSGKTIEVKPSSLLQGETCFHLPVFYGEDDFPIYSIEDFYGLLTQINKNA